MKSGRNENSRGDRKRKIAALKVKLKALTDKVEAAEGDGDTSDGESDDSDPSKIIKKRRGGKKHKP